MMNEYDVILYNSTKKFGYSNRENIGLGYLAAALRNKDRKVKIVDSLLDSLSPEEAINKMKKYKFKIIGVSFLSYGYEETKRFVELAKKTFEGVTIVAGGHFVSFTYEEVLRDIPEIDLICVGEGEVSFPKIVDMVYEGVEYDIPGVVRRNQKNIDLLQDQDLDGVKFPARDYLPKVLNEGGIVALSTSRGCYGTCTFCSVHNYYKKYVGKKWRGRSPENVVEEIEFLVNEYKVKAIDIIDDNFIGPGRIGKQRAIDIAALILKKKIDIEINFDLRVNDIDENLISIWKKAGLKRVLIGIESICDEDLKFYKKHITPEMIKEKISILKKYNIEYTLGTLYWHPYAKVESIIKNIEFLNEINYVEANILSILNVYKGTESQKIMSEDNILSGDYRNYDWNFQNERTQKAFKILIEEVKKGYYLNKLLGERPKMNYEIYKKNQNLVLNILKNIDDDKQIAHIIDKYEDELEMIYEKYILNKTA